MANEVTYKNSVKLLTSGIIQVKKVGDQTEDSMRRLWNDVEALSKQVRGQGQRVLILSDATEEGLMDYDARNVSAIIGAQLDYDKSASYGASKRLHAVRDMMVRAEKLDEKVANFETREEAIAWLLK